MDLILKPIVVETPKILQNQQIYVHTEPTVTKVRIGEVETLEPDEEAYVKSTQYSDETVLDIGIPKGFVGAKIVNVELIDENEKGTIYKFLFDDGQSVEILSPRGPKGEKGGTFDLGEEVGTAYEGNKGKANADAILLNTTNINNILKEQFEQNSQIEANDKELQNIKKALLQNEVLVVSKIDNKTTTRITAGGENIVDSQLTPVLEIKGNTVKTKNLIPYPYVESSKTTGGITFTSNSDGSVTINGAATSTVTFTLFRNKTSLPAGFEVGKTYTLSGKTAGVWVQANAYNESGTETGWITTNAVKSRVLEDTIKGLNIYIVVASGTTVNNETIYPMINEGSTALPYQPYFKGLKRANISAIKSTGRNIFDSSLLLQGAGWTETDGVYTGWASSLLNMTLFENVNGYTTPMAVSLTAKNVQERNSLHINVEYTDGSTGSLIQVRYAEWTQYSNTTSSSKVVKRISGSYGNGDKVSVKDFCIRYGDNSEYEPYKEEIYQLPETLELGEFDSFNPQTGELIRQTGSATSSVGFTEEEIAGYDGAIISSDKLSLEYKLATPTKTTIYGSPKEYTAWDKGSETIIQGTIDNSKYGAIPTVTNEYILKIGGEE